MPAAIEGYLGMIKAAAASVVGAAVLALGVLSQPTAAEAQIYTYPHEGGGWTVGPGFFGFSGYPWPGPPFASPLLKPTYGCYFTRTRLQNAWRQVEVCE
jgi:hypothetical protein